MTKGVALAFWALAFALATGLSWLIPPMQSPDETSHLARAYLVAQGHWLLQPAPEILQPPKDPKVAAFVSRLGGQADAGGLVDPSLLSFMAANLNLALDSKLRLSAEQQQALAELRWSEARIHFSIPRTGYYFPLVYAPQAAGLAIGMALSQIWANKTRSFLTALGIIVGVASVTAVIAALTGLKAKVLSEFESVGAARLYVFPNRPDNVPRAKFPWEKCRLKVSEAQAIMEQCPSIKGISPIVDLPMSVESDTELIDGMTVNGIWPAWHDAVGRKVMRGRPFSQIDIDTARQVALVNEAAVTELKIDTDGNGGLGEHILLGGRRFLVIGVVETTQARMLGMNSSEAEIFIPFSVAEKLLDGWYFMQFAAIATSPETAEEAKAYGLVDEVVKSRKELKGIDKPAE